MLLQFHPIGALPHTSAVVKRALNSPRPIRCVFTHQQVILQLIRGEGFRASGSGILARLQQLINLSLREIIHKDVPLAVQQLIVDRTPRFIFPGKIIQITGESSGNRFICIFSLTLAMM